MISLVLVNLVSSGKWQFLLWNGNDLTSSVAAICEGEIKNVVSYPAITLIPEPLKSAADIGS